MNVPLQYNESARLQALHRYGILDTAPEEPFDQFVRLAAEVCETHAAGLSFIDVDRQWMKARLGIHVTENPRSETLCTHAILQTDLLVVEDTTKSEQFAEKGCVLGPPHVRFYAGMPLIAEDGFAIGVLFVIDPQPRSMSTLQRNALRLMGQLAMHQVDLRHRAHNLDPGSKRSIAPGEGLHDVMTDLPGRPIFEDRLANALLQAKRHARLVSVMLMDLEAPPAGAVMDEVYADRLRQSAAVRLKRTVRRSDTVARVGVNRFGLVCPNLNTGADALLVCRKVMRAFEEPLTFDGRTHRAHINVGLSLWPDDGDKADSLVQCAQSALEKAEANGPDTFVVHDSMDAAYAARS